MKKNFPMLAAIAFSIIVGFSFLFVKITLTYENQSLILAQRFLFAFLSIVIFSIIRRVDLRLNKKEIIMIFFISIFYPILFFSTQIIGLDKTTVTEAGIIQATVPAVTVLFAGLILKERVNKIQISGILLSMIGVVFLQIMGSNGNYEFHLFGNVLIIASVFATAIWQVLSKRTSKTVKPVQIVIYVITIGFLFFNSFYFIKGGTVGKYVSSLGTLQYVGSILFLGVLSTFGTALLSIYAISKLPVIQVSVFNNVATLITILSGILILKEPFYFYHIIGAIIIISGVLIVNLKRNKVKI
ncbi:DMT family transporter [Jeotgalibaca sp. MA1X17-3]|uniref:DMT family transporter n=1 Tax=Jeotgalibaca sp. MA1X17-3 TaxID=2908211 RepID=UPI001F45E2BF|nr:DMT family transporter [Jeotgalibaca sp. MA1X17-3]UJF16019.1 DMT family transporter [Jeotgalibaca sp. MA1X17-3]